MSNLTKKAEIKALVNTKEMEDRVSKLFMNNEAKRDKFLASLLNISMDYSLRDCTAVSIVKSSLALAELDLPLNKNLGMAYIVKYKKEAEAVIGYKGYLQLAERSGKTVKVKEIFNCDDFTMRDDGFNEIITFIPNLDKRKDYEPEWVDKNLKGVLVSFKDNVTGNITSRFVSAGKIDQLVGMSKSKGTKFSPYLNWNLEMKMGKAIKYVLSKTPMSDIVARAIEIDNKLDTKLVEDSSKNTHSSFLEQDLLEEIEVEPTNENQGEINAK